MYKACLWESLPQNVTLYINTLYGSRISSAWMVRVFVYHILFVARSWQSCRANTDFNGEYEVKTLTVLSAFCLVAKTNTTVSWWILKCFPQSLRWTLAICRFFWRAPSAQSAMRWHSRDAPPDTWMIILQCEVRYGSDICNCWFHAEHISN